MHKAYVLLSTFLISACAQTQWTHSTRTQADFQRDSAYCQNEAMRNVQQQIAAPVAPVYTPPTQYNTDCSRIGNSMNCTTVGSSNYSAQIAQQNAQNMAQHGANIGTALSRQSYADNCMVTMGYRKQQISQSSAGNPTSDASQNVKFLNEELKQMSDSIKDQVCPKPSLQIVLSKTPCNINAARVSHFTDPSFLNDSEKPAFDEYYDLISSYQNKEIEIISKYMEQPLRDNFIAMRRKQHLEINNDRVELYKGAITWGEFNKRRTAAQAKAAQERTDLINRFR